MCYRLENSQSLTAFFNICLKIWIIIKKLVEKKFNFNFNLRQKKFFCPLSRGGGAKDLSGLSTLKNNFFGGFPKGVWVIYYINIMKFLNKTVYNL